MHDDLRSEQEREAELARAKAVKELLDREIADAWHAVLSTEQGRLVVWSVLERCHLYETTYTGNQLAAFMEGERNIGLSILNDHVFVEGVSLYADMLIEGEARDARLQDALEQLETAEQEHDDE